MSIYTIDQLFQYSAGLTPSHHQGSGPPGAAASFSGVISMMENLLGEHFDPFREKLHKMFMFEDFVHRHQYLFRISD